jgi:hypothetical protein
MKMNAGVLLIVIGCVGLVVSGICIPIGIDIVRRPKPFLQGELAPVQVDPNANFTVNLGSNLLVTDYASMKNGFNLNRGIHIEGFDYPVQIQVISGRLSISAWINGNNGNMVAHIVDNNWEVNPDNFYDRNFSNNAFEVVSRNPIGGKRIPALQVEVGINNYVYIGGLFYYKSERILVTPKGMFINPSDQQIANSIETLFAYPSTKHLGQRN